MEYEITDKDIRAMRVEFDKYRTRGLDKIPVSRIPRVCAASVPLDEAELKNIETEGQDGDGMIDFDKLLALTALQLQARQGVNFYRTVFNMVDVERRGYLSLQQLRQLIDKLVELTPEMNLNNADIDDLVSAVQTNKVTFDDFYALMTE